MNYVLLVVILLACGGAYYEHTTDQKQIDDLQTQVTSLQADKQKLTDQANQSKTSLDEATAKNQALSQQVKEMEIKLSSTPVVSPASAPTPATPVAVTATAPVAPASPTASATPAAPAKMTPDQVAQATVLITGDNASGTGFLVKTADGPAIVTNLHVLANNPNLKITTNSGVTITPIALKGAADRDLAMLSIKDGNFTYLPLATDISGTVQPQDVVVTPGNSQGGNVVLNTTGAALAIGPDRVEFSNPIYHGNSGGPVFHSKSGTVIAVVTEAIKVDVTNDLDKTSFQSRSSAIASSIRYFGLRLDTVPKWEPYNMQQFQNETAFIAGFNKQSRSLDAYLNADSKQTNATASTNDDSAQLYLSDEKIMAAHHTFRDALGGGADTSSQIDALRRLSFDLGSIADKDMETIQNLSNFYTFDQQRAKNEAAYRKALKAEIDAFSSDVSRIASLPRTNSSN